jgi:hypothetical protein
MLRRADIAAAKQSAAIAAAHARKARCATKLEPLLRFEQPRAVFVAKHCATIKETSRSFRTSRRSSTERDQGYHQLKMITELIY